jgi:hypothetical protein
MAIRFNIIYPGQCDTGDAGYPYGKARNVTVAHDGTGTPFEKAWLNDVYGFLQSLLAIASITPSDTPDKVGASQYLNAVRWCTANVNQLATFSAGLIVDDLVVTDTAAFAGVVVFAGAMSVNGVATFGPAASFTNGFTSHGGAVFATGGNVLIQDGLSVTGTTALNATTAAKEIVLQGQGRIRQRVVYAPDANHTYDAIDFTLLVFGGSLGAHTYKLNDAAAEGAELRLVNYSTNAQTIQNSAGGTPYWAPQVPAASGITPGILDVVWLNNGTYTGWSRVN